MKVEVKFEDKETLEWIMRCFVQAILESYTPPHLTTPAVRRAVRYYDETMKQVGGKPYTEMYDL